MNVRSDNTATEARRGRGRPLVDDKRRKLLDAALKLFAARGYHGTNVPEVAQAAGVGTGSLYRYFAHKEALVNEVYRDAKLRLRAALLDGASLPTRVSSASPEDRRAEPSFSARSSGRVSGTPLRGLPAADSLALAESWFRDLWRRLAAFAAADPDAFRFLEMQDHVEYLDRESKQLEMSVLAPLWVAGQQLRASHEAATGVSIDVLIALLWGAFVGLIKAQRLGYLPLDEARLDEACTACWRMIAPAVAPPNERRAPSRARSSAPRRSKGSP